MSDSIEAAGQPEQAGQTWSLWQYIGPYRAKIAFGVAMLIATNCLFLAEPILLGKIIDALRGDNAAGQVPELALYMVAFAIATAITRIASRVALFNAAREAEYDLRSDLLGRLLVFEPAFYRKNPTGDIMSRLTNDVQSMRALWGPGILNVVNTAVAFATTLTMMTLIDPWLTLAAVVPYSLVVIFGRLFGQRLFRASRAVQAQLGRLTSSVQEDLTGINIIKTYTLEDQRRNQFRGLSEDLLHRNMDLTNVRGQLVPLFSAMASLSVVIVIWMGGKSVIEKSITLGEFVEFSSYLARLMWPTLALGWILSMFQRGVASWSRLKDLLSYQPDIVDGPRDNIDIVRGDIEIRNLTIEIDGKTILDDISLDMPAGTVTAIVGRTGSGKSTLIEALPRLTNVPRGTVFLDGHDITELPLPSLRHAIGYAPQEAFLFSTTIARNIAFGYERGQNSDGKGNPEAVSSSGRSGTDSELPARADGQLDSRLVDAASAAGLARDLNSLPNGYDTVVGERGITLSGGQRQRVALARALATTPKVLILDDSLSSVDAETEREILGHLTAVMQGRTAILISHRVAAVKRADQIVCLDQGRVVEVGSHEELLAAGGVYAEVYQTQLEPESVRGDEYDGQDDDYDDDIGQDDRDDRYANKADRAGDAVSNGSATRGTP
ncbi:MAG: ABC transporter ATP-binding protein/permease [Proteobacteria bacterium]|nr:ABC transporter ATP-binding protein/permease [Pseudomonadota bacterium]